MKKVAIVYSKYTPLIDAINSKLENTVCLQEFPREGFDYIVDVSSGKKKLCTKPCLASHYSLLPAFEGEEPVKLAFLAGAKVTGITFYNANPFKIVAQYPVFITNASHFDDVEKELEYLEQIIFPIVIEKLLNNEPIELKNILSKGCGGCSGCKH